jgi:hypothetical protein
MLVLQLTFSLSHFPLYIVYKVKAQSSGLKAGASNLRGTAGAEKLDGMSP